MRIQRENEQTQLRDKSKKRWSTQAKSGQNWRQEKARVKGPKLKRIELLSERKAETLEEEILKNKGRTRKRMKAETKRWTLLGRGRNLEVDLEY